jgi:hypothetical protein
MQVSDCWPFWPHLLVVEKRDCVFLRKGATIPDIGGSSSEGEAELERCLMPLEIPEIQGDWIVRRSTRDLDISLDQ